jgi:O-acetyl-ADP-ribose deacetylase (regulator of RNase III)
MLRIHLRDRNPDIVAAWRRSFAGLANVDVTEGAIFDVRADAVVSPANSFGFMDGGIDLVYSQRFGWDLQDRLREHLVDAHHGELPVGQAAVIETFDEEIPWLISAPTMRVPTDVSDSVNAYLAFRAALLAAKAKAAIESILCPGLATAIGRMPPERCARQMAAAYAVVVLGQTPRPLALGGAVDLHHQLLR